MGFLLSRLSVSLFFSTSPSFLQMKIASLQRSVLLVLIVAHPYRSEPVNGSKEGRSGRVRRQGKLLCLGNALVTTLVNELLNANRKRIKENEPIYIGGTQNLGVIVLKNGRAINVSQITPIAVVNVSSIQI